MPFPFAGLAERTERLIEGTAADNVLLLEKRRVFRVVWNEAAKAHMTERALSPETLTREKKPGFPDTNLDETANTVPLQ